MNASRASSVRCSFEGPSGVVVPRVVPGVVDMGSRWGCWACISGADCVLFVPVVVVAGVVVVVDVVVEVAAPVAFDVVCEPGADDNVGSGK